MIPYAGLLIQVAIAGLGFFYLKDRLEGDNGGDFATAAAFATAILVITFSAVFLFRAKILSGLNSMRGIIVAASVPLILGAITGAGVYIALKPGYRDKNIWEVPTVTEIIEREERLRTILPIALAVGGLGLIMVWRYIK